jgi:hypothetical protein
MIFFAEIEKTHPKIQMESLVTLTSQNNLEKGQNGELIVPDLRSYSTLNNCSPTSF